MEQLIIFAILLSLGYFFRLETSSITKGSGKQIGSVEVLAYGTAVYFCK